MTRIRLTTTAITALCVVATPALPGAVASAQQTVRTLDIGGPPGDTTARICLTDSVIAAALAAFNNPGAMRVYGSSRIQATDTVVGGYSLFQGQLNLGGTVRGDLVVLNGDARVTRTGTVSGTITVLGGRLIIDPGAAVGRTSVCEGQPALTRLPDGTIARARPSRTIRSITSAFAWQVGGYRVTPHIGIGQYNRVEALPTQVGANLSRGLSATDTARAELYGVFRTGREPNGSRPALGWHGSATYQHQGALPFTVGIEGGSTIEPTVDRPYSPAEAGLSAFLFRTDYYDWYMRRGGSITASVRPWREVTFSGRFDVSRQTTVLASDAFSIFNNTDAWRPNPLIDDGTYRTVAARMIWDARDPVLYPVLSWYVRADLRHVSSNKLTPVSVPTTIRDALPTSGYGETEGQLDIQAGWRLDPEQRLKFRIAGGGYLGGDPLTIQRRRAMGGADPMLGYDFRGINCDRQRKPYLSTPALCDRNASIQVEYHRTLPIDLRTRIGSYSIGIRKPDLVLLGDAGTAWLAGDSAGRVPTGRIQSLGEWRSDVGVGVTSGVFGLYLAKSLTDALPVRLILLLSPRF